MTDIIFTRFDVERLLEELGERLSRRNIRAELFIVGGAAMALAYNTARTTRDIDALFIPRDEVLGEARLMANELGLPANWLNDAVRDHEPPQSDPSPTTVATFGKVSITVASPEYVLAMKAMVSRKSPSDLQDAATLCQHLNIASEPELEQVVKRFFGPGALGAQELWLEDIIEAAATLDPGANEPSLPTTPPVAAALPAVVTARTVEPAQSLAPPPLKPPASTGGISI